MLNYQRVVRILTLPRCFFFCFNLEKHSFSGSIGAPMPWQIQNWWVFSMVAMIGYGCLLLVVIFCPRNAAGYANGNKRVFVPPRERFLPPRLRLRSFFFSTGTECRWESTHQWRGYDIIYIMLPATGMSPRTKGMGIYGYIWVYMGIYGYIWAYNIWVHMWV